MITTNFECLLGEAKKLSGRGLWYPILKNFNERHSLALVKPCLLLREKNQRNEEINLIDFSFKNFKARNRTIFPSLKIKLD